MNVDPGWVAAGLMFVTSVGGVVINAVRNGKSQSRRFGQMEGKVEGFCNGLKGRMDSVEKSVDNRMDSMETSVNNLGQRIDNLVNGINKPSRRTKKS